MANAYGFICMDLFLISSLLKNRRMVYDITVEDDTTQNMATLCVISF